MDGRNLIILHLIHSNNLQTREIVLDLLLKMMALNLLYEMKVLAKNSSLIDKDYEVVSKLYT